MTTVRGDYFEWRIELPVGTWSGLTAACQVRSLDRATVVHTFTPSVNQNANGSATVSMIAPKNTTRGWAPGTYRIDCELERPGTWGPFTVTPDGTDALVVTPDDTITTG